MSAVNILIDIHCARPNWALEYQKYYIANSQFPIYRIYINNDLITERSWLWGDEHLIREDIWAELDPAAVNKIRLQPILKLAGIAKFKVDNLIVNNSPAVVQDFNDLEVSFTL
jgi:hypothetical protein